MNQIAIAARGRIASAQVLLTIFALSAAALAGCKSDDSSVQRDDTASVASPGSASPATTSPSAASPSALSAPPSNIPPVVTPDGFHDDNGEQVYDARKSVDVTGDGRAETIILHARGADADKAAVQLAIHDASGNGLYSAGWNTQSYFKYTPRAGKSAGAAAALVLGQLKRVLADSAFIRKSAKPDRDAIRYDLKEAAVRTKHSLPPDAPLIGSQLDEVERYVVTDSAIDAIVKEVTGLPTFTYHAGGELTYTIAFSKSKQRFVRIFSCC